MVQRALEPVPAASPNQTDSFPPQEPLGLLGWIAGYKVLKAALALAGGILVWKLGHRDLVVVAHNLLLRFRIAPDGWVATKVLARLAHLHPDKLELAASLLFIYAVLYCVEAVGLFLQKRWAEWLTVVQTSLLIPFEIFGLIREPGAFGFLALLTSVGVVAYLVRRLRRHSHVERKTWAGGVPIELTADPAVERD
jgi:uncharacterized membrane protein (DUF2068 family)